MRAVTNRRFNTDALGADLSLVNPTLDPQPIGGSIIPEICRQRSLSL